MSSDSPSTDPGAPGTQSVRVLGRVVERMFSPRDVSLPNLCVFSNAAAALQADWATAYAARVAHVDDVSLVRLPTGTEVCGRAGFAARVGPFLVSEQLTRDAPVDLAHTMRLFDAGDATLEVDAETVLIARFGEGTWGHWLVELLPKLAVCEAMWPGRFRYAVPHWAIRSGLLGDRMLESMAAYGVTAERLVQVRSDAVVRFSRLHALTPVFCDIMHPDVAGLLNRIDPPRPSPVAKLALLRNDRRRGVSNMDAVRRVLEDHDFTCIDIAAKSFSEQRSLFAGAGTVFSVLGSGLSGLIFSPDKARVLTAAPDRFADRFFYGLLQVRQGSGWAEVRGPVATPDPQHYRDSAFEIPMPDLQRALRVLGA